MVQNSEAGNRDILNREIEFTFGQIALAPDNESAWNYLRGLALSPSSFTVDMTALQELKERSEEFILLYIHVSSVSCEILILI